MALIAGIDLGGTAINYTFLTPPEKFLIEGLCEHPARSKEGPDICLQQIADGLALLRSDRRRAREQDHEKQPLQLLRSRLAESRS